MKSIRDYINLVSETNLLSEKVTLNPDGSMPQTQTVNGVTMNAPANSIQTGSGGVLKTGSGAAVTSGTPAPAPDAAAAAKAKLTPSQLKWLGGADATDAAIMARMPKPLPGETVPGAAPAAAAPAAAAPAAAAPVDDRNEMDKASDLAAAQKANGVDPATGQMVSMKDPVTGQMINPENGLPVTQQTAPAQAAQPAAKPKVPAKSDPAVLKLQQDLIAKGAKIKADGVMGPATQAAQKQFGGAPAAAPGLDASGRATAATDPRVAGNQPAQAAQPAATPAAPAAPATGTFAADTAARKQAANPMGLTKESRVARNDHAFIDELNAMRMIAGLPTRNKW